MSASRRHIRPIRSLPAALLIVLLLPSPAAASSTFIAVADGQWANPATWGGAVPPSSGATIAIPAGRQVYVGTENEVHLDRATVTIDGTLLADGVFEAGPGSNVTIGTGTVDVAATFELVGGCLLDGTCPPTAPVLTIHGTLSSRTSGFIDISSYTNTVNTGSVINAGRLQMDQQATVANSGTIANTGTIDSQNLLFNGFFHPSQLTNTGTVSNASGGTMNWGGSLLNHGLFENRGTVDVHASDDLHSGDVLNDAGTIDNFGVITADSGFRNTGTDPATLIHNRAGGHISVGSARFAILSGRLLNDQGAVLSMTNKGSVTNRAVIENDGLVDNQGVLDNSGTGSIGTRCDGTYSGNAPTGNAPLFWCLLAGVVPASLHFEDVAIGSSSASQRITYTNLADAGAGSINVGEVATQGPDAAEFTLANDLCSNTSVAPGASCTVDVTFGPTAAGGMGANLVIPSNALFSPKVVPLAGNSPTNVVVSQIFSAEFGSPLSNSFIELFNRGTTPVDLTGWSVQYRHLAGMTWQKTDLPEVSLAPGQYFLVEGAAGLFGTAALPTPDVVGTIAVSPEMGVVALTSSQNLIAAATTCPTANVVDLVGYGPTTCHEGPAAASGAPGGTAAELRLGSGCVDTDSNLPDFMPGPANPRNTGSPTVSCAVALLPHLGATPASLDFGSLVVGSPSLAQRVTIANTAAPGATSLQIGQLVPQGADANDFTLLNDLCSNHNLGAGVTCTVDVQFTPAATGARNASVAIPSNAGSNPDAIPVGGTGTTAVPPPAQITVAPAELDFLARTIGTSFSNQLTVTNSGPVGAASLQLGQLAETGDAGDFPLDQDTCSGASLMAGASCTVRVTFSPTATGFRSAHLDVPSDAIFGSTGVTLIGTGLPGPFNVSGATSVTPTSISVTFTDQPNAFQATQLVNYSVPGLILSGTPTLSGNTVTITTAQQLAQGYTVTVYDVTRATDGAPLATTIASFIGTTPPPAPGASLDTTSLAFGGVPVGTTSATQTVTLTNTGLGSLTIASASAIGANAADFRVISNACTNAVVASTSTCSVVVAFAPTAIGARSATLRFSDDAASSPQDVSLTGTGVAPIAQVSPGSIDFGTVTVATTTAHRTITVTDTGNATLMVTGASISGLNAPEFTIAATTCAAPVAAGASCTIDVTFSPAAVGSRTASLSLMTNAAASPQTVSLVGTGGTPPPSADLSVGISATPIEAKTGQKLTYTITVFNAGPSTATTIVVNDSLSSQSTFVSATLAGGTCVTPVKGASGVVTCTFASLPSGSSKPLQIVVTVIAKKASITNTVTVSGATTDPNLTNNTASITTRGK